MPWNNDAVWLQTRLRRLFDSNGFPDYISTTEVVQLRISPYGPNGHLYLLLFRRIMPDIKCMIFLMIEWLLLFASNE